MEHFEIDLSKYGKKGTYFFNLSQQYENVVFTDFDQVSELLTELACLLGDEELPESYKVRLALNIIVDAKAQYSGFSPIPQKK